MNELLSHLCKRMHKNAPEYLLQIKQLHVCVYICVYIYIYVCMYVLPRVNYVSAMRN